MNLFQPVQLEHPSKIGFQTPTVVYGSSADDKGGFTGERRFLSFDFVHTGGDQDPGGYAADVSAPFTGLNADEVGADFENLGGVRFSCVAP